MKWIQSLGGPLICIEDQHRTTWGGIDRLSSFAENASVDYDRVYTCDNPLYTLSVGSSEALILMGEGPADTGIGRTTSGEPVIVQIVAAEPELDETQFLKLEEEFFADPDQVLAFDVTSSDLVIFDTAEPGDDIIEGQLEFRLAPGSYDVAAKYYYPDADTQVLLYRFVLRQT